MCKDLRVAAMGDGSVVLVPLVAVAVEDRRVREGDREVACWVMSVVAVAVVAVVVVVVLVVPVA